MCKSSVWREVFQNRENGRKRIDGLQKCDHTKNLNMAVVQKRQR